MCLARIWCKVALHHQDVFALKGAAWHPLNMHKPIVTTPSRRSSTRALHCFGQFSILHALCSGGDNIHCFDQVLANFSSADETWSDCVQLVDVQCSMFMAEWTGPDPTHGAGKASELRLLVSFVKQRLHSSSLLKGNG